jgi:phosphoribosylformylglycinamidine synthase
VHDVSDGGLLVALAEMAMAGGLGARVYGAPVLVPPHAFWFGEDQARYVVTVAAEAADDVIARARGIGVTVRRLGVTNGDAINLPGERPMLVQVLTERFESWFPAYMAGARP